MSNKLPIGANCREDVNFDLLIERARAVGGFRGVLVQAGAEYLPQIARLTAVADVVIWRTHHDDALFATAGDAKLWVQSRYEDMRRHGVDATRIWLHLHNEAGVHRDMVEWERKAISHGIATYGMRFVALNPSVGGPDMAGIQAARPVLQLANEYPQHVIVGLHEYFYVKHDAYNEDFVWHVGRIKNWLAYCAEQGFNNVQFAITEAGSDNLMDVSGREPDRWPRTVAPDGAIFNELRGYRTLEAAYKQDFPGEFETLGLGGLVARETRRAWDKAWAARAQFALFFSVGRKWSSGWHGAAPWHQFDVEHDESFWAYLNAWAEERNNGGPVRDTLRFMTGVSLHKRTGPGTAYQTVQLVSANTVIEFWADVTEIADGYVWYQVTDGTFMAARKADNSSVYLVPPPEPPVEPPPPPPVEPPPVDDTQAKVKAQIGALIEALQRIEALL